MNKQCETCLLTHLKAKLECSSTMITTNLDLNFKFWDFVAPCQTVEAVQLVKEEHDNAHQIWKVYDGSHAQISISFHRWCCLDGVVWNLSGYESSHFTL